GVDAIVTHVGAVAAVLGDDHAALVRMLADLSARIVTKAAALSGVCLLLLDQRDGAVQSDGQDVLVGADVGKRLAMLDVGTKAADALNDRLTIISAGARARAR